MYMYIMHICICIMHCIYTYASLFLPCEWHVHRSSLTCGCCSSWSARRSTSWSTSSSTSWGRASWSSSGSTGLRGPPLLRLGRPTCMERWWLGWELIEWLESLMIHTSLSNIRLLQTGDPQRSKDLPTEGQREGSIWGGRRRRRKRWKILFHCKERQPWVHHRLPHRLCHLCLLHGHAGEIFHQKRHLIFMEIDILPVKSIKDKI